MGRPKVPTKYKSTKLCTALYLSEIAYIKSCDPQGRKSFVRGLRAILLKSGYAQFNVPEPKK